MTALLQQALKFIQATPHGDNCFLHNDGGEYDSCFCGKASIVNLLEGEIESTELQAAIAAASAAMQLLTCVWTEQDDDDMPGTYASACGEMWSFVDGGAAENNVRFCHGCGKPVEVTKAAP